MNQLRLHRSAVGRAFGGLVGLLFVTCGAMADVVPTNGMVVTSDTTLVPGTYNLPDGISIGASNITLDLNGATLVGSNFDNYGITCIGHDDVTITGGTIRGYYYGMRIEDVSGVWVTNNDLSDNWLDPESLTDAAPFLSINVGPNLGDRVNLGGGLFVHQATDLYIAGNIAMRQENGIDLFNVDQSEVRENQLSFNTGWGLHMRQCSDNLVVDNVADYCTRPGLRDSSGFLVVYASHRNEFINNVFRYSGDGFFIGNEWGCPSNDNLIMGNDGSFAGANAFEATFSSGNQFIDNIAEGSRYGFWLGYSHTGNVIRGNSIQFNTVAGIEIEHGQGNTIENNEIAWNGGSGIVLRTDNQEHFPDSIFTCLNLPDQESSRDYTIRGNVFHHNGDYAIFLNNTTDSQIYNNLIAAEPGSSGTVWSNGANNTWALAPSAGENIVGGPFIAGNYWSDYEGTDNDGDGIGDTLLPHFAGGMVAPPGDPFPLVGDPTFGQIDNPQSQCRRGWYDLGRNTRDTGDTFNTSNGTHFATDGVELLLLEGSNSVRLSRFNPVSARYIRLADCPDSVWDGGAFVYAGGLYYAGVGLPLDTDTGDGKGPDLYAYDPVDDIWLTRARCVINGHAYATESLAYDPSTGLIYAAIHRAQNGGIDQATRRFAIYDTVADTWIGFTSPGPDIFGPATEAEYLGGRVYVWRGGGGGATPSGAQAYLGVYDTATDEWSTTPTLYDCRVRPGWRSGAFDVWAPAVVADAARGLIYVIGSEDNRRLYVFDVVAQCWTVAAEMPYDGGWGSSLEYVAASDALYLIDGRNADGSPQGTAVMVYAAGDLNADGVVDAGDFAGLGGCLQGPDIARDDACMLVDDDCDDDVDLYDLAAFQQLFGE